MMTAVPATERISGTLRGLIDSRLDTIDRMLLGRFPRAERLEVVREVESQIYDLLGERAEQGGEALTREDVLAVLGRLDPPEAYLPDEANEDASAARVMETPFGDRRRPVPVHPAGANAAGGRLAPTSGVLGIIALVFLLMQFPLVVALANHFRESVLLVLGGWYAITIIVLVLGTLAIVLAVRAGLRRLWAVAGLVLGILDVFGSVGMAVLGLFL
jgi:hypothetical protein